MRLHDVLMGHVDSLMSESQRLGQQTARLDTHAVVGKRPTAALGAADAGMVDRMHDFQKIDTVGPAAHQHADLWTDAQQQLRRLEIQTRVALGSARWVR